MTAAGRLWSWWTESRPWQTNCSLGLLGFALVCLTRQMIAENPDNHAYLMGLSGVSSWSLVIYLAALLVVLARPSNVNRWTFPIILGVAIACRLVALFPEPYLSSDVYRYAWDGVVQHAGINPYRYVPGDAALTALRAPNQDLFDNMNRRDYAHTIYPPAAQVFFYLVTFLSPTVTFMKMAMVLVEGITLWGLVLLLREFGMRRETTILYAWSPLLIWEIGGSGHVDSLVMAFVVFAVLFRLRSRMGLAGVFLALAVLTKFYPLVLFPAMYRRGDWKLPAVMAALAAGFYALYLSAGTMVFGFLGGYAHEEGMTTGERFFLLDWAQHRLGLAWLTNNAFLAFAALVFAGLSLWAWWTGCRAESPRDAFLPPTLGLALALMLLFSPHYPWYVAWLVPFFVFFPSPTTFVYVGALFYLCTTEWATGGGAPQFFLNEMLYGTVLFAAIVELVLRRLPGTRRWFARPLVLRSGVRR